MKVIKISSIMIVSLALFACQRPSGNETEAPHEKERLEEPQVRDGIPETALRDSLATDTADTATVAADTMETDTTE